ncbi:MAG: HAD-IIIA family hydrolase [candidate division KSB1 bacterium]|nr:HAD-IIIA family hydrolase [candidate division KSB1 bacterium]
MENSKKLNSFHSRVRGARPAVFLDRDGTLIEDHGFLHDPAQVEFFPDTVAALRCLLPYFDLFIVTNQSGVGKGLISLTDVERINTHVTRYLEEHGILLQETYVCPHDRSENCECIKPKPFFLQKAADDYGIDLSRSWTIGDHPHDVEFGINAGADGIYVLTGHGEKHRRELDGNTIVVNGIKEAVAYILDKKKTLAASK